MLQAIFYARFHPERGPSVIHQYPDGSLIRQQTSSSDHEPCLSFSDISAYVIPPYELCDQALSICTNGYRVLGFPISLEDTKYDRNRFTFNVCFVLDEADDVRLWQQVVKKTAAFFRGLEEEDGLLQAEELLDNMKWAGEDGYPVEDVGVIYPLLKGIMEDLNAYGETCTRVDETQVLNLRLISPRCAPPKVRSWDVPLLICSLPTPEQWTWDLTLQRIRPHLNGVNHVKRIAELADVECKLVRRAVQELLHHEYITLLDIFHFQAIYGVTTDFSYFVTDPDMVRECANYIKTDAEHSQLDAKSVIDLYRSLSPGLTLRDFVLTHPNQFQAVDARRFITFGVIKGFLRRIHKYALAISSANTPPAHALLGGSDSSPTKAYPRSNEDVVREFDRAWRKAALSSGWATPPYEPPQMQAQDAVAVESSAPQGSLDSAEDLKQRREDEMLRKYLDGQHCLDEVCVAMGMSEKRIVERVRNKRVFGEVVLFNK